MKKTIAWLAVLLLVVLPFAGCAATPAEKTVVNVGAIQGPTGIGMAHLMAADEAGTATNDYNFTVASSPEEISGKLVNNELNMAAVPTNMAAALYNKTQGKVKLLAVNTLGVLYILENGNTIQSLEDLRGKTVYSTGEGANPEYILRHVLEKNNLTDEVTIEFLAENTELAAKMVSGAVTLAMVPEPVVSTITAQNKDVRVALSMNDAWNAVADENSRLMMGCVAVRTEFLESNKAAVDAFLKEYQTSVNATDDVDATAFLCEKYGIIPKAAIAKKAIPNCQLTFVKGEEMKKQIAGYYNVLFAANPKSVGGKLPDDVFYYVG